MNMTLEVLLSCMNQSDDTIIGKSNLTDENVLVVNQCNSQSDEVVQTSKKHRMINSATRGLSVSRNIAVSNAMGDICVLADDDEVFVSGLYESVLRAYKELPDADVIVFEVENLNCKIKKKVHRLKGMELFRVASVQISFRRSSVSGNVAFDTKIGSGTKFGAGEDNKFILDCKRKKMKIYYYPVKIAALKESESHWFTGYDAEFFYRDAMGNRYVMGLPLAVLYALHFLLFKRNLYSQTISIWRAGYYSIRGLMNRELYTK